MTHPDWTPGREEAPPGAPLERTALAWNRSALTVVAIAATIERMGARSGQTVPALVATFLLLAYAGGVWLYGGRMYAERRRGGELSHETQRRALRLITAATLAGGVLALGFSLMT